MESPEEDSKFQSGDVKEEPAKARPTFDWVEDVEREEKERQLNNDTKPKPKRKNRPRHRRSKPNSKLEIKRFPTVKPVLNGTNVGLFFDFLKTKQYWCLGIFCRINKF